MRAALVATFSVEASGSDIEEALGGFALEVGAPVQACYVATADPGAEDAMRFWQAGLETGLTMANPRSFPKTLANSTTATLAKLLDVRGPTYTLLGGVEAVVNATLHALTDIGEAVVSSGLVVGIDAEGAIAAFVLSGGAGPIECAWSNDRPPIEPSIEASSPAAVISDIERTLLAGDIAVAGDVRSGWIVCRPAVSEA